MATATTNVNLRPEDGWTLVATAPLYVKIKPQHSSPWEVAVAAAAPAATLRGLTYGRNPEFKREEFELPIATTENVYVRVTEVNQREPTTAKLGFSVIVKT